MPANYVSKKDIEAGRRFAKICASLWPGASRQIIADNLGVKNESRIRLFESGSIPEIPVLMFFDNSGYSIEWLLLGKGEMKKSPPTSASGGKEVTLEVAELCAVLVDFQGELAQYQVDAIRGTISADDFRDVIRAAIEGAEGVEAWRLHRKDRRRLSS